MSSAPQIQELQRQASDAYQSGRLADALDACRGILALQPDRADVMGFAGMISLKLGDHAEAARLYRAALAQRPNHAEAQYNLGNALKNLGQADEAMAAYTRAIELRPDLAPAYHNLGNVLQSLGRSEEAADAYRRTIELAPQVAEPRRNLGIALQDLGRMDEAVAAFRDAVALEPGWPQGYNTLVTALILAGKADDAVAACDQWLSQHPGSVEALAFKCSALNEAGAQAELETLLDFDRFVRMRTWEAPPGYADLRAFNAALADHVVGHPTMRVPDKDHPTYHHPNLQITEELIGESDGPMARLEAMMVEAVRDYERTLPDDPAHPFVANWPRRWRISAWATLLEGHGNLVSHIHLDGYLGGVYYPDVPDVVDQPEHHPAGWFELGRAPEELPCRAEPRIRAIQPAEGLMLTFPGYFYHRTVPFEGSGRRVSIAFDVVRDG